MTFLASTSRGILTGILTGVVTLSGVAVGLTGPDADGSTVDVVVRGATAADAAAAVVAHGGTVTTTLDVVDGVAATVPASAVDTLAGVVEVHADAPIDLADGSEPSIIADAAVAAAAAAEQAAERAETARRFAEDARKRAEDLAGDGEVAGAIAAEADAIGAAAGAAEAVVSAQDARAAAVAARNELAALGDADDDGDDEFDDDVEFEDDAVEDEFKRAVDAAEQAAKAVADAADESAKAGEQVTKAAAAVVEAEETAQQRADELEELRAKMAAERREDAVKAEQRAAEDTYGISPSDARDLLGGRWLEREGHDGSGVDVAVIDSGVADLSDFDDRLETAIDLSGAPDEARDGRGHGTAMASIIGLDDGDDSGVAPDAGIVDVKVASTDGVTDVSQVIAAIDWVIANRATDGRNIRVLSLSFGTDGVQDYASSPLAMAVEAAWANGIVVVVSAGNHGSDLGRLSTPAIDPFVIAVGAADLRETVDPSDDRVPTWSARGDGARNPDLVAPGVSLLAAVPADSDAARSNAARYRSGFLPGSGTSQATAFTAGVVAALLEAQPLLTPDEVKALLVETARPLDGVGARAAGHGVLDLDAIGDLLQLDPEATKVRGRAQGHQRSKGDGSLDGDRGSFKVQLPDGEVIDGDETPFGTFDRDAWTDSTWTGSTWTGSTWTGSTWTGSTWTGSTWTGSTWTGSTWTGSTWTGSTWTGSTWTTVGWR